MCIPIEKNVNYCYAATKILYAQVLVKLLFYERSSNRISSPTYKKVVSQFLAGNFYCKFGIYNAKSIFCQNIVPLGQLEAEILIDLCSIKRSYFPDPIKRSYVTE